MYLSTKLSEVKVKATNEESGEVTGYASTFGNVDSYGDSIKNGAFTNTLKDHSTTNTPIPLLFEHDRGLNSHVGVITSAKEDTTGLLITAKLDIDTESGQRAFTLAKAGRITGMSIGFVPVDVVPGTIDGKSVNLIKEVDLREVSLVLNPADSKARVTSVKSAADRTALVKKAEAFSVVTRSDGSDGLSGSGTSLLKSRNSMLHEIKSVIDHYGDNMPDSVFSAVTKKIGDLEAIDAKITKGEEKAANLAALNALQWDDDSPHHSNTKSEEDTTMNHRLVTKSEDRHKVATTIAQGLHVKEGESVASGVVVVGEVLAPVSTGTGIIPTESAPLNLLAAIPTAVSNSPAFSFLRQTLRNLNADVVEVGQEKPKSQLGFERVDTKLDVVAHIVREVDEYILRDLAGLKSFISNEMVAGVFEKVESLIFDALNTADGAQVQAFTTDSFTTTRLAKAKLQSIGLAPAFYMINHDDWALMETAKAEGSGNFLFNSAPVNTTEGTLWGVPVLPTIHAAPGAAKLIATESAMLFTDGQVRVSVNTSQSDFEHNQVSFRAEGRFKPVTVRSMGIVDVPLVEPAEG